MQHNVIPGAEAKGMGIIGMKVFADAAMYHKKPDWSRAPEDVYRKVGSPELPSRPLIEYALTTPGIHTLIIGIGQIDEDPMKCQLVQNFYAAQIEPNGMSAEERKKIEDYAAQVKEGKTNYFQAIEKQGLSAPQKLRLTENKLNWDTAFADDMPISHYEILAGGTLLGKVEHKPQILRSQPYVFELEKSGDGIIVAAVDKAGNRAEVNLV
jgi:hypothetical protein